MALPALPNLLPPAEELGAPAQVAGLTASDPNKATDETAEADVDLERLKRYFTEYRDLTSEARTEGLRDQEYYDSKHWTSAERAELQKRGQPDNVFNHIKLAINGILGVVARGKADPRAWPRTPQAEGTADVATDVLRYAADLNRFNRTKIDCLKDMLVPGNMAVIVGADSDLNPTVTQIRWEEFFGDPRSRRPDWKDARYLGIAKWMYADDLKALYPDKGSDIEAAVDNSVAGGLLPDASFMDRPNWGLTGWVDRKQRRILTIEIFYRERGEWLRCVFHGSGVLESGPSPYLDHKGRPHCAIEAQSAYVDTDNFRYGVVRDMRGPQDEINKRRSKLLYLLSVSQIEVRDPSAISVDPDEARKEAAKPDGVIPFGWAKVSTTDMATGQASLLAEAKAEIERFGPNPAVLGRDGNDQSGRALLARQQSGLVELAPIYAGAEDWELRVYRQIWARVKQYWKEPQYIRVTDDEGSPKFVGINQPMLGQPMPTVDPNAPQGFSMQAPVLGYQNAVGEMDVDIELETQQHVATVQQEQFSTLVDLIRSNPAYAQDVPFEVLLKLSTMPHEKAVLDQIKAARQQGEAQRAQAQAQAQQMQAALAASQIEERTARAKQLNASAGAQSAKAALDLHAAHAEPQLDMLKAGIDAGLSDQAAAQQGQPPQGPQGPPPAPQPQPNAFAASQ